MRFKILTEKISSSFPEKISRNFKSLVANAERDTPGIFDENPDMYRQLALQAVQKSDSKFQKNLKDIAPIVASSIIERGTDGNNFLSLIVRFPDEELLSKSADKLSYINNLYNRNMVDLNVGLDNTVEVNGKEVPLIYLSPSLYERSDDDFKYIANAFALLSNRNYLSKNFRDTSIVDLNEFYNDDGTLKPKEEISRIIDKWYSDKGKPREDDRDRKSSYTMRDLFKQGVGKNQRPVDFLFGLWKDYGHRLSKSDAKIVGSNLSDKNLIFRNVIDGSFNEKIFSDINNTSKVARDLFAYIVDNIGEQV